MEEQPCRQGPSDQPAHLPAATWAWRRSCRQTSWAAPAQPVTTRQLVDRRAR